MICAHARLYFVKNKILPERFFVLDKQIVTACMLMAVNLS